MKLQDRFLRYVQIHTTSDEESETSPSAQREYDLANLLIEELRAMGIEDTTLSEDGYVYAHIPASEGF